MAGSLLKSQPISGIVFLATLLTLLAGCNNGATEQTTTGSSPSATISSSTTLTQTGTESPNPVNSTVPTEVEWTKCQGISVLLLGPFSVYTGTTPSGWGSNQAGLLNEMRYDFFKCDRISWGALERGPIYTVQEWTANFDDPPKCGVGAQNRKILESIGFSDPEVADYARRVYGMNAYAADFTFAHTPLAPDAQAEDWTGTWTPSGAATSRITFRDPTFGFNSTYEFTTRLYWHNGQGISFMDLDATYETSDLGSGPAEGELAEPMLWGRAGDSHFATTQANVEGNSSFSGSISRFSDVECTKPL